MRKIRLVLIVTLLLIISFYTPAVCIAEDTPAKASASVETVLGGVEKRYAGKGFSADFRQESTIKAMDIRDTASGMLYVKRPGKMRWEYTEPEQQIIVTDGVELWVYRPEDSQVMVGRAPVFFGGGKGAGFLSDINLIRKDFEVQMEESKDADLYTLKLTPYRKTEELALVRLLVQRKTFNLNRIITYNAYGDETLINLLNLQLDQDLNDELFQFQVPEGVEVIELEQ